MNRPIRPYRELDVQRHQLDLAALAAEAREAIEALERLLRHGIAATSTGEALPIGLSRRDLRAS